MTNELSLPDKIIKNTVKEDLLKNYSQNTLIRGLVQIVPYGGIIDSVLTTSYNNILVDRAKTFYEELGLGRIEITPDLINNEDFLHAYFSTFKAAIYTRQRKKIRFFARLLNNGVSDSNINNPDNYEEYLKILDELTYKELYLLFTLNAIENKTSNDDLKAMKHWNEFESRIMVDLNLTQEELRSALIRVSRTGCFIERINMFGTSGAYGYTSELFKTLVKLIDLKGEDLVNTPESINI